MIKNLLNSDDSNLSITTKDWSCFSNYFWEEYLLNEKLLFCCSSTNYNLNSILFEFPFSLSLSNKKRRKVVKDCTKGTERRV